MTAGPRLMKSRGPNRAATPIREENNTRNREARDQCDAGRLFVVAEGADHEDPEEGERHVQRAVDDERRDVGHGEVPGSEEAWWHQQGAAPGHRQRGARSPQPHRPSSSPWRSARSSRAAGRGSSRRKVRRRRRQPPASRASRSVRQPGRRGILARTRRWPGRRSAGTGGLIRNAMRQEMVFTSRPLRTGRGWSGSRPTCSAQRPKDCPCSSPWKVAVMMAIDLGTRTAPAAPCRIRQDDQELHRRCDHAPEARWAAKLRVPIANTPPAAEGVAERPGQDEECAQGDEVAVGDIRLRTRASRTGRRTIPRRSSAVRGSPPRCPGRRCLTRRMTASSVQRFRAGVRAAASATRVPPGVRMTPSFRCGLSSNRLPTKFGR